MRQKSVFGNNKHITKRKGYTQLKREKKQGSDWSKGKLVVRDYVKLIINGRIWRKELYYRYIERDMYGIWISKRIEIIKLLNSRWIVDKWVNKRSGNNCWIGIEMLILNVIKWLMVNNNGCNWNVIGCCRWNKSIKKD